MAPKWPPKGPKTHQNGPKWPILAQKDLAIFFRVPEEKNRIFFCSKSLFMTPPRVWDAQKPKIDPLGPPMDPHLGHFVAILGHFGPQKRDFVEKSLLAPDHLQSSPDGGPFVPGSILGVRLPHLWLNLAEDAIQCDPTPFLPHARTHTRSLASPASPASPSPKPKPRQRQG